MSSVICTTMCTSPLCTLPFWLQCVPPYVYPGSWDGTSWAVSSFFNELSGQVYADLAVTAGERRQVARAVTGLYDAAAAALLQDHSALRRRDADVARLLATKGEVPEETQAQYEKARRAFEQLQRSTASLAEALDRKPPELPKVQYCAVPYNTVLFGAVDQSFPPLESPLQFQR